MAKEHTFFCKSFTKINHKWLNLIVTRKLHEETRYRDKHGTYNQIVLTWKPNSFAKL